MTDAPPRITTAAVIAAVEAKQPLNLPRRMTPAERAEIARAMQHYMQRDDLVVNEAGALLGLSNREMAHKCAKEIGLKSTQSAIKRVQSAILLHISPEAAERGRLKRWGEQNAELQQKRAERAALDQRIHDMRVAGYRRVQIMAELGITATRLKDACERMGAVQVQRPEGKWARRQREQAERVRAAQAEALRHVEELRRLARIMPVAHAARRMGISLRRAERLAVQHNIKSAIRRLPAPPKPVPPPRIEQPRKLPPTPAPSPCVSNPAYVPTRNPMMTAAQQANADRMRRVIGAQRAPARPTVEPPSRAEADRLIAEAIAAGRLTRCPAAFAATVNNGTGL